MKLVCVALLLIASAFAQNSTVASYEAMVKRVKAGDLGVDFRAMRMACMAIPSCKPRSTKAELSELVGSDHRKVIAFGNKLLDQGYVNVEVHATLAGHYQALGAQATADDRAKAAFHQNVMVALVRSIVSAGDGKTPATAFEVITDREQYVVLSTAGLPYSGPNVVKFEKLSQNGHQYARWQVKNAQGTLVTIYFNTDAFQEKSVVGND